MIRLIEGEGGLRYGGTPNRMPERSCCFSIEYYENYIEEMREVI